MIDYEERYEGNGEDVETFHGGGSSPLAGANDDGGGGTEEFSDSKSQQFRYFWIMDFPSGLIKEVVKGCKGHPGCH
ncbi:hypothetical protein HanIR_Chr05g0246531 [Helianthus annuus]|nr:hypothetical protein HanIR_Chr05g0246531 [Helianthus annuus]